MLKIYIYLLTLETLLNYKGCITHNIVVYFLDATLLNNYSIELKLVHMHVVCTV